MRCYVFLLLQLQDGKEYNRLVYGKSILNYVFTKTYILIFLKKLLTLLVV